MSGGPDHCVPGEWQVLAPNLNVRIRAWEVDGTRRLDRRHAEAPQQQHQKQLQNQQQQHQGQQGQSPGVAGAAHASTEGPAFAADLPQKFMLLHEPASMSLRFSQALSR